MKPKTILILGDTLAFAILTFIGFAVHGETDLSFLPRMSAVLFPVLFSWFVLAPWLGLFDEPVTTNPKLLWRIPLVILFGTPLAVIIRSAILGSAALPVFAFFLGITNALGMTAWRWAYGFIARRFSK